MQSEQVIQPFELLGVTPNSSLVDVRKAYYRLARFCHPDKGGNPADMRILHGAYQWICHQLQNSSSPTDEIIEARKQEFFDFLQSQQNQKIPPWQDVLQSCIDVDFDSLYNSLKTSNDDFIKKVAQTMFVSYLQQHDFDISPNEYPSILQQFLIPPKESMAASFEGGYGNQMIPANAPVDIEPISFGQSEMIPYKEPLILPSPSQTAHEIHILTQKSLPDYSISSAMDYYKAYQSPSQDVWDQLKKDYEPRFHADIHQQQHVMEMERQLFDLSIAPTKLDLIDP